MSMILLSPSHQEKVWGFEEWQFSTHTNGMTQLKGTNTSLLTQLGGSLPILIKYIVAHETLSVQVHPDDVYAKAHTNDLGKTECWYITEAEPGAKLIFGLKSGLTQEELAQIIADNQLETYLEFIEVEAGDMIYIPAGTVHAIMGGLKLIEIQQSSDTTYRLYDWGRDRETHIEDSLAVIDYEQKNGAKKIPSREFSQLVTPYFTVSKQSIATKLTLPINEPTALTILSDGMKVIDENDAHYVAKNETIYFEANTVATIQGSGDILFTTWQAMSV